jgi:hypothetical protein
MAAVAESHSEATVGDTARPMIAIAAIETTSGERRCERGGLEDRIVMAVPSPNSISKAYAVSQ